MLGVPLAVFVVGVLVWAALLGVSTHPRVRAAWGFPETPLSPPWSRRARWIVAAWGSLALAPVLGLAAWGVLEGRAPSERIAPHCAATVGFTDPTEHYSPDQLRMFAQLWNGPASLCDLTRYMQCANWGQVAQRVDLVRARVRALGIEMRDRSDSALACAPYPWEQASLPPWGVARRSGY